MLLMILGSFLIVQTALTQSIIVQSPDKKIQTTAAIEGNGQLACSVKNEKVVTAGDVLCAKMASGGGRSW
jgi:hypothetical protein